MNLINSKKRSTFNSISFEIILTLLFFLSLFPFISQAQVTQDFSISSAICINENLIDVSVACTTIYEPVCGCNGVTYPNECVAQNHYGVTEWTDGPCNNCNLEVDITSFEYTCLGGDVCVGVFSGQAPFTISVYNTNTGTTTTSDNFEVCFSDLVPGNYEVVIVDASGCSAVLFFSIPVIDYNIEAEVTDVSCFGGHNGAIDLWIPAGLPVWIEWTGPNGFVANTEDIDNLFAGLYTVQVALIDGSCYASGTFEVGQADELSAEFIRTGSQCDGQVDGCLIIDGGTQPYHVWVFTCDNPVSGNLPEPDFDANGGVFVDGMEQTDVVDLNADGIYQNEICAQNIPSGTYYVLVADANWCWTFEVIEIGEEEGITAEFEITSENCDDQVDGCLTVNGGTAPYDVFVWQLPNTDPANTDVSITPNGPTINGVSPNSDVEFENDGTTNNYQRCAQNIPAGTYLVLVVDANHCYVLLTVEIPHANPLNIDFEFTGNQCDGQVDGCLLIDGGTQPYHLWVFTCPNPQPVLPEPDFNANGDVTVAGMTQTDAIDVQPVDPIGFYGNEICVEDIPAGIYYVIVADQNWCWDYIRVEIPEEEGLSAEFEITSDVCADQVDGCLIINGGSSPYHVYVWNLPTPYPATNAVDVSTTVPTIDGIAPNSPVEFEEFGIAGDFVRCANNIPAGTYLVLVVDANGCYTLLTVEIPHTNPLTAEFFITSQACDAQVDGCLLVMGGTQPYNINVFTCPDSLIGTNLPDPVIGANGDVSVAGMYPNYDLLDTNSSILPGDEICVEDIPAGTYYVIIDDANGCWTYLIVEIPETNGLTLVGEMIDVSCFGGNDGAIELSIVGGVPPYTAYWTNETGETGDDFHHLSAGTYEVFVFDANQCTATATFTIHQPMELNAEFEITSDNCADQVDGCLHVAGGTGPYQVFVWNLPQPYPTTNVVDVTTNVPTIDGIAPNAPVEFENDGTTGNYIRCANNIPAGAYLVLVVDANGCYTILTVEIPETQGLTIVGEVKDVSCHGGNDGAIDIHITGGTPPYTSYWVNNAGETGDHFDKLSAGTYEVLVFDANQCFAVAIFTIHEPTQLKAEFQITSEACDAEIDGCLYIHGGTPAYRLWVFTCPNPLPTLPEPDFSTDVPSVDGMVLNSDVDFPTVSVPGELICAENIAPATYYVLIADENNCWIFETIVIEPAAGLGVEGEVSHVTCSGNDGAIDITVIGNHSPYFFEWSNGATTEDIDGLEAGVYTVQVYSQNDFCTATATFIVEGFGALETNLTFDPYGSYACVDPVGGTEPYMIEWIDLNTGEPINNSDVYCVQGLAPGAYMVNVVDANGCEASEIFFIEEQLCSGGEAVVDPSEIESGDHTNFLLYNYSGVSIQWQFKTDNTPWLNIPGATSDNYVTPDINTALDKEIWVRAEVVCTNGDVVYSSEALLIVFGDPDLDIQAVAADRDLFNPVSPKVEFTTELSDAFPTITEAYVNVQFKATLESTTSVSVMDLNGKLYETTDFAQVNAGQVERLNFSSFPSGMYLIRVQNEKHIVTHKVFVERQ